MDSTLSKDRYWEERKADTESDWGDRLKFLDSYRASVNHPHRDLIIDVLRGTMFQSVLEVGCCNGPNLVKIRQAFPLAWLGGEDVNKEAIADAQKWLQADFKVCKLPQISAEDKSWDVVLADACLMYVEDIDTALSEMKRVAKNSVIIFDWFTPDEQKINHSYTRDYQKRLQNSGFKNIQIRQLTPFTWPSENWIKYGRFIVAQVP